MCCLDAIMVCNSSEHFFAMPFGGERGGWGGDGSCGVRLWVGAGRHAIWCKARYKATAHILPGPLGFYLGVPRKECGIRSSVHGLLGVAPALCCPESDGVGQDTLLADRARGSPFSQPQVCSLDGLTLHWGKEPDCNWEPCFRGGLCHLEPHEMNGAFSPTCRPVLQGSCSPATYDPARGVAPVAL